MQSEGCRANVFQSNGAFVHRVNAQYDVLGEKAALHEEFHKNMYELLQLVPDDVKNNPRFGLMTREELMCEIRGSWAREHQDHEIFKREYLGIWVENDNE